MTPSAAKGSPVGSPVCSIEGCVGVPVIRGWCRLHYQRWRKHGTPLLERRTLADRMAALSAVGDGCWEWQGAHDGDGYGLIKIDGKLRRATRVAWETAYGPIPAGLSVLHSCDNPPCVRPDHLMLGTQRANIRDMLAKGRRPRRVA
jgi:hypothetical protein